MRLRLLGILGLLVAFMSASSSGQAADRLVATGAGRPAPTAAAPAMDALARMPLAFVANRGQTDTRVRFYAVGSHYAFYLTRTGVVLSLVKRSTRQSARGVALDWRFVGANRHVRLDAQQRLAGRVNSFHGSDTARWRTGLARHAQVRYRNLWPGIDLVMSGQAGTLKYEFRVRPGASVGDIRLAYRGATGLALDRDGGLRVKTTDGVLKDSAPVAYQLIDGTRVNVGSRFAIRRAGGAGRYGFAVGSGYRPDRALIIDPGLAYSTFLGGASDEDGNGVAVDAAGNAYVTGVTQSPDFPTTAGAFDRTGAQSNSLDAFVTKLNPSGTALVYSTFLGGSNFDLGRDITIDASGNAYVAGTTYSPSFPTTGGAFDRTFNVDSCPRCGIDQTDGFVAKLNPSGSGLLYSTFLGGTQPDDAMDIALDGARNAYVTGETQSLNFPTTTGAFDRTPNGSTNTFVTKLNAAGSALAYSTLLGGSENELPGGLAVDASGNAFVSGSTRSTDFPTTPGAYDTTHSGGAVDQLFEVFVTKLNPAGSALVYSTFVGGTNTDFGGQIALDASGDAYVVGSTASPEFPTTPGTIDPVFAGDPFDDFVLKFNPAGSRLVYSTFTKGAGASTIAVDASGDAWLAGGAGPDGPATPDAVDATYNGGASDAHIVKLNPTASAFLFATFLGGTNTDGVVDMALDPTGDVYLVGNTFSADFPTTAGAPDRTFGGDLSIFWGDAFVAKLAMGGTTPPPPPPPPPPNPLPAPSLIAPANDVRSAPGQALAFDWSDVTGAAGYTIQIDDSSSFSAPFTVTQTVASSTFTTSTLPTKKLWWRVRANDSTGSPGAWSATRQFEIKK